MGILLIVDDALGTQVEAGGDELALVAQDRGQDLRVPELAGQGLDHRHVVFEAEEGEGLRPGGDTTLRAMCSGLR